MTKPVITKVDGIYFDVEKILQDIEQYVYSDSEFDVERYNRLDQISLREGIDWFDGVGSLYVNKGGEYVFLDTRKYNKTSHKIANTYLDSVINQVTEIGRIEGVGIGRIRIMRMKPKTCLTLHRDLEEFRYHIPLKTNYKCFFVSELTVERMPEIGALYRFKTNTEHTAVNASTEIRIHLLFDTYKL